MLVSEVVRPRPINIGLDAATPQTNIWVVLEHRKIQSHQPPSIAIPWSVVMSVNLEAKPIQRIAVMTSGGDSPGMNAAIRAVVRYAFEDLELHRVEAACQPDNMASRRVLEKAGFAQEGVARAYLKINGAWRDHLLFAIVNAAG